MKIRKAGYEHNGLKLGQRVMYGGGLATIIGFDENTHPSSMFVLISCDNTRLNEKLTSTSKYISSVLKEFVDYYGNIYARWAFPSNITAVTEQKVSVPKQVSSIPVKVEDNLVFKQPEVEDINGEDVFILSGRSVIYFNKSLGVYGIATCNSNELKSYNKEIGKALAFYRAHMKLAEE